MPPGDVLQLDENGRVAIEARNREEGSALRGEYDLLLAKIRHANREDRSFRQGGIAEPLDVCLAGRPLSHARLNADIAAGFVDACWHVGREHGLAPGPGWPRPGTGPVEQLVDGHIPFPCARHQAPSPPHPPKTVAAPAAESDER
jgi:hypothetical protein